MSIYTPDENMQRNLASEIEAIPPRPHHSALIAAANRVCAGRDFRYTLNRGGWYRPGGVITADGTLLSESIEDWARAELGLCGNDMHELVERHAGGNLMATRHAGRTHYFVAPYGPSPADFLQLEIEEVQEVLDRKLINPDALPDDLQELLEPFTPAGLEAQPVGAPRYRFRRLLDMRQAVARVSSSEKRNAGLSRMMSEWAHSSAAARGHFCNHWIVALREHQDRYRNPVLSVSLVSRRARDLKPFQWNVELTGVQMAGQLQAFDRAAGYPAAWYMHLVGSTITPAKVAYAVAKDLDAGFCYLPETEAALIKGWVAAPYSV